MAEVYLNNKYVGKVEDGKAFIKELVEQRRKGIFEKSINFNYEEKSDEVHILSTKGRVLRPLIVVKEGKSLLTDEHVKKIEKGELNWEDLVNEGIIEYLDAAEEDNVFIAMKEEDLTEEHTHLEISPLAMLGLCTSLVPYGDYNPSARLNAGSKNQKQALSLYTANYLLRMDMDVNLLYHPQIPIVQSIMHEVSNFNEHPNGQNLVVAIISAEGYNMEDAIVINKGAIDRGLARSTYFRPVLAEELKYSGGLVDEICIPDKEVKGYRSEKDYRFLDEDGVITPEAKVREGDVVIGRVSPPRFLNSEDEHSLNFSIKRESSIALKHGEKGVVDFVLLSDSEEGNKLVQVRMRDERIPEIGDKFTSRHGQKGVIGMILKQEDMPFSSNGIIPDIMFSPHGLPSRMTIGHLLELLGGKTGALSGRYVDGTIFDGEKEERLRNELLSLGFRDNGTELLYNGKTGEVYKAKIYIGNMYYLKLKHMVANKMHARARGPIQLLTRQPTEGRAKEGGLRLGEMEKDAFVAHGAALLLKERFDADRTVVPVCENCGLLAIYNQYKNISYCPVCGDNVEISNIEVAYAFKLLLDELKSMCIYPSLKLKIKFKE